MTCLKQGIKAVQLTSVMRTFPDDEYRGISTNPHGQPSEEVNLLEPITSDWQGYGKPSGLEGKGSKGRGQGRHLATLEKPLPLTRVSRV